MKLTGYRAFLMGTARDDRPVRGIWVSAPEKFRGLTVQRREDVEAAAGQSGVMTAAGSNSGVSMSDGTDAARGVL